MEVVVNGSRIRSWLEAVLGVAASGLGLVTLFWHDWIELLFGVDPDQGSGAVEWLLVAFLFGVGGALIWTARLESARAAGEGGRA
jgi:hypothetical protein